MLLLGPLNSPRLSAAQPHDFEPFSGFHLAGNGNPDHNWILHITDIPHFFDRGPTPTVHAGYDVYVYEDRTVLLVEYRQSKGRVYERVTEWQMSLDDEKKPNALSPS
jgi:hypothetical protein